jgi:4-carboxymuconolactone decarboxylase
MSLTPQEERLVRVSAAIVLGDWRALQRLRAEAPPGEPDRAWREAVLQSHLFAGFPRLVEAYEVLDRAGGLGPPDSDEVRSEPDLPDRGRPLFDLIYADQSAAVRTKLTTYHPDFAAWIAGHAYGRVLTRPGLTPRQRELLAVASLATLGQSRQLTSHARGALHCGATNQDLADVFSALTPLVAAPLLQSAQSTLARLLD